MATGTKTQMTTQVNDYLLTWIEGFLVDRKARGLINNTFPFDSHKLKKIQPVLQNAPGS